MTRRTLLAGTTTGILAAAGLAALRPGPGAPDAAAPGAPASVVVVAMRDVGGIYRFRPDAVTARRGDLLRFVLDGSVPHNVEFLRGRVPPGADLHGLWIGPYLMRRGDAYELRIHHGFPDGVYAFRCSPHSPLGMEGRLVVRGAAA